MCYTKTTVKIESKELTFGQEIEAPQMAKELATYIKKGFKVTLIKSGRFDKEVLAVINANKPKKETPKKNINKTIKVNLIHKRSKLNIELTELICFNGDYSKAKILSADFEKPTFQKIKEDSEGDYIFFGWFVPDGFGSTKEVKAKMYLLGDYWK